MKILTADQIRGVDRYTIEHEPIDSLALMERASETLAAWIAEHSEPGETLVFFIGKGNNGGDGLAVARMLYNAGFECRVYTLFDKRELSEECRYNLERLPRGLKAIPFREVASFPEAILPERGVVIDALLGSGVRGEASGPAAEAIERINASRPVRVISIDLPSGMATEYGNDPAKIVRATTTLTLQFPKLALLLPEAGACAGEVVVLPIGLDESYLEETESPYYYVDESLADSLRRPRAKFSHKGDYGHALLVCGSEGMAGAALLAASGALRSGCGLLTVHLPREERQALYAHCPSAMLSGDPKPYFSTLPTDLERFTAIGVGCGLGQHPGSVQALEALLRLGKPMVIDADALNILAANPALQALVPAGSILTPHPGELRRLVGPWTDDRRRNELALALSARFNSYIVLKGAHTMTCSPDGRCYFNSTGNAGMAKGGSGDVLTGLITGLLARGYAPGTAAVLGVYLHGSAGDRAAEYYGAESMNSGDLAEFIQA